MAEKLGVEFRFFIIYRFPSPGTVELRGEGTDGYDLEVDLIRDSLSRVEEDEEQLNSLPSLPSAVRTRLIRELPNIRVTFIERNIRPLPVPPLNPSRVVYEIEVSCNGTHSIPGPTPGIYCRAGQQGEAQISPDGTTFVFERST